MSYYSLDDRANFILRPGWGLHTLYFLLLTEDCGILADVLLTLGPMGGSSTGKQVSGRRARGKRKKMGKDNNCGKGENDTSSLDKILCVLQNRGKVDDTSGKEAAVNDARVSWDRVNNSYCNMLVTIAGMDTNSNYFSRFENQLAVTKIQVDSAAKLLEDAEKKLKVTQTVNIEDENSSTSEDESSSATGSNLESDSDKDAASVDNGSFDNGSLDNNFDIDPQVGENTCDSE